MAEREGSFHKRVQQHFGDIVYIPQPRRKLLPKLLEMWLKTRDMQFGLSMPTHGPESQISEGETQTFAVDII